MFSGTTRSLPPCHPAPSRNEEDQQTVRGTVCPTNDSLRARCDSRSDLGELQVHRLGVGERLDGACGHAASGADRAEERARERHRFERAGEAHSQRVSRTARGRVPRGAQTRVSMPCWPTLAFTGKCVPRTVFWSGSLLKPDLERLDLFRASDFHVALLAGPGLRPSSPTASRRIDGDALKPARQIAGSVVVSSQDQPECRRNHHDPGT